MAIRFARWDLDTNGTITPVLRIARDGMVGETGTVPAVGDQHAIVDTHPGRREEIRVDGDGTDIVGSRRGHRCHVDLAVQHRAKHQRTPEKQRRK